VVLSDTGSEHTIILEAGGGKYSQAYQAIQDSFVQITGMRVMSCDRYGFGRSELGPDDFNAMDEADALKKVLEAQGFKDGVLYYHRDNRPPYQMFCMGDDTFRFDKLDYFRVRFGRDKSGRIIKIVGVYSTGQTDQNKRDE